MKFTITERKNELLISFSYDVPFDGLKTNNMTLSYEDHNKAQIIKLVLKFIEDYEESIRKLR
jgi:hypothetical protein